MKRFSAIVPFLLFISCLHAQVMPVVKSGLAFQNFRTEEGLSDNDIANIYQDSRGFIWINTREGLNRFDGSNFKRFYTSKKSPNSLPSNPLLLSFSVNAYSQIEGDVRSKVNIPIPKALIVSKDTANNIIDSVVTDDRGFYSFRTLQPGIYFIEAKAPGFEVRLYKNVVARKRIANLNVGRDKSNATRLQIVLIPVKPPK